MNKHLELALERVSQLTGLHPEAIQMNDCRKPVFAHSRYFVCAILRAHGYGTEQIGKWLMGKDHSSVSYAIRKFNEILNNPHSEYFAQAYIIYDEIRNNKKINTNNSINQLIIHHEAEIKRLRQKLV